MRDKAIEWIKNDRGRKITLFGKTDKSFNRLGKYKKNVLSS
jgi:hypothetical protein